jgi:hypothetical protein
MLCVLGGWRLYAKRPATCIYELSLQQTGVCIHIIELYLDNLTPYKGFPVIPAGN